MIFDLENAGVGDSDFKDIGGEILHAVGTRTYGLGVNDPVLIPDILRDEMIEAGFDHFIAELGLEDIRQGFHRQEEIDSRRMPTAILFGECASWDHIVNVGVIRQLSSPGMQDTEEASKIAADIFIIESKLFD